MKTRTRATIAVAMLCSGAAAASETLTIAYDAQGRMVRIERRSPALTPTIANYGYDAADSIANRSVTIAP